MATPRRAFGTALSVNRWFNQELTPETRAPILMAQECGEDRASIMKRFNVSRGAVRSTEKRYAESQQITSTPRKGRLPILSDRDVHSAIRMVKKDPRITMYELQQAMPTSPCAIIIRARLEKENLKQWRAARRIPITPEIAAVRLQFAKEWLEKEDELVRES